MSTAAVTAIQRAASSNGSRLRNTEQGPPCPECQGANTIRKGKRRNRMRSLQVYQCSECLHRFALGDAGKHKSYPLKTILETISTFNKGHSITATQAILRRRLHIHIPERTISSWIAEHRSLATYARLRGDAQSLFPADQLVKI